MPGDRSNTELVRAAWLIAWIESLRIGASEHDESWIRRWSDIAENYISREDVLLIVKKYLAACKHTKQRDKNRIFPLK